MIVDILKKIINFLGIRKYILKLLTVYGRIFPYRVVSRGGIKYGIDLTEAIDFNIFLGGWEPKTLKFLRDNLRSGDVVIEVGANVGAHTLVMSRIIEKSGHVYAFEPTDFAMSKLKRNVELNKEFSGNITLLQNIVTNGELSVPRQRIRSSWKLDSESPAVYAEEECSFSEPVSIDRFVDEYKIGKLNLIKIDTDGYDLKVLQGAQKALSVFSPVVFIELCQYTLMEQGDSVQEIFYLLANIGYTGYFEDGQKIISIEEVLNFVKMDTSINAIFKFS